MCTKRTGEPSPWHVSSFKDRPFSANTPQLSRDSVMFVNTVIVAMINSIKWIFVCIEVVEII